MKKETDHKSRKNKKKKSLSCIYIICWIVIPLAIISALVLDAIGIYPFNTERLLVMGSCILISLIPFFNEITIKNISIKKKNKK